MSNYDVIVIGAGAAGGAITARLAAHGVRVLCLEQGTYLDASLRDREQSVHEALAATDFSPVAAGRNGEADFPLDDSDSDMGPLTWNGVGGSIALWAGAYPRLKPSDFRVRTLDGVAEDWPVSYDELVEKFEESEALFGVAGLAGNTAYPVREGYEYPHPPYPLRPIGERLAAAHNELGWHWWPSTSASYGRAFDGINNSGESATCSSSSVERRERHAGWVMWQAALRDGAVLRTEAYVSRVLSENGKVVGVEYIDAVGKEHRVFAEQVVIAANGVGTPRLLFMSKSDEHPDGLANSSGLVGKNLMFHPFSLVWGYFPESVESYESHYENAMNSHEFYETDPDRDFVRGSLWALCSGGGPAANALRIDTWGDAHAEAFEQHFAKGAAWGIFGEDLPEESNHVALDESALDARGLPGVSIHYKFSENSRRLMAFSEERAVESLRAAGATQVKVDSMIKYTGWHLLGTTRMGEDPKTSVVDGYGETHDVENLFIASGSVFVTAGAVNPTNTIVALALRTADRILGRRQTGSEDSGDTA